jgi:hypothetical protein
MFNSFCILNIYFCIASFIPDEDVDGDYKAQPCAGARRAEVWSLEIEW